MPPSPAPLFTPPPVVVGHRGSRLRVPENTPASFAAAAAEGAGWVELDVRLAADGTAVVHHDPHLPDGRAVVGCTAGELAAAGVADLAQVLQGLPAGLGVDLEVKAIPGDPDFDEALPVVDETRRVAAAHLGDRPALLTSFNPAVLLAAAERGLELPLGLLTYGVDLAAAVEAAVELGCTAVCPHDTTDGLDVDGVAAAHRAGLEVLVWTVDQPARVVALAAAGVDAICTDDPALAVATLEG